MHYRTRIDSSNLYMPYKSSIHSSVLPLLSETTNYEQHKSSLSAIVIRDRFQLKTYPITALSVGSNAGQKNYLTGNIGIGSGIDLSSKKFFLSAKFLPSYLKQSFVGDSIQQLTNAVPGSSRELSPNLFAEYEFLMAYKPNRFFTFIGGNGRNFFGEGYRSLIYSDNAGSTPFFKIETNFGSIKYVNIYNIWKDNSISPTDNSLDKTKFSAMHYISWNITKSFNLSVFETVVWQNSDDPINRGFDLNYINPVVFYRPVEYGAGSADNVLLGLNMNYKFDHHNGVYTQLIIDDFLLKEIKARSRWWANKYGFQIGYKSNEFLQKKNVYFQMEFNTVRPFTYAHKNSVQSYGHLNKSVTHPIGANFYEILNIISVKKKNFRITNKITYSGYGTSDTSSTNFGQNPFLSYNDRNGDHDHFIMQGFKKNVFNENITVEYPLYEKLQLYLNATYNWRIEKNPTGFLHNHYFSLGIRSRLWNKYDDL